MFIGSANTSLDAKNRFIIPAKFRKNINPDEAQKFIINKGVLNCIDVYPLSSWRKIEQKLAKLNPFNPKDAKFLRIFTLHANECEADNQYRIILPQVLLDYAKIEKEILVVGMADKLELWNPKEYDLYLNISSDEYEILTQEVMGGDLNVTKFT